MSRVGEPGGGASGARPSATATPGPHHFTGRPGTAATTLRSDQPEAPSSPSNAEPAESDSGPPLEWRFNPWRERPLTSALASLFTLGSIGLLAVLGVKPLGYAALGAALAFSLGPLLLPSRCRVDDEGVAHRRVLGWERRRWSDIRRAVRVRGGLLLSPFEHPQRLDSFRALLLPMPRHDRGALNARLAPRLARHGLEGR
jgi:hypothetical protein